MFKPNLITKSAATRATHLGVCKCGRRPKSCRGVHTIGLDRVQTFDARTLGVEANGKMPIPYRIRTR